MFPNNVVDKLSADRSIGARIVEVLRRMILTQKLKPGERLVEAKIAKELQVSITPVRQAFATLASQGLLTVFPYRGTYVTVLSREYISDIFSVRQMLEPQVARLAFPNLKSEDAEYLTKLCEESDRFNEEGDMIASIERDVEFHEFFFTKCGNVLMKEIWDLMKSRIIFFQCIFRQKCQIEIPLLVVRHGEIIQAVREMNEEALIKAIGHHLTETLGRAMPSEDESGSYQ